VLLAGCFHEVSVMRYWSTQSGALQVLGERLAPPSAFGLLAHNRRTPLTPSPASGRQMSPSPRMFVSAAVTRVLRSPTS
jgi:hypothetical protein